jgi:hypothetical protein
LNRWRGRLADRRRCLYHGRLRCLRNFLRKDNSNPHWLRFRSFQRFWTAALQNQN